MDFSWFRAGFVAAMNGVKSHARKSVTDTKRFEHVANCKWEIDAWLQRLVLCPYPECTTTHGLAERHALKA
jgi:hypothetical protein